MQSTNIEDLYNKVFSEANNKSPEMTLQTLVTHPQMEMNSINNIGIKNMWNNGWTGQSNRLDSQTSAPRSASLTLPSTLTNGLTTATSPLIQDNTSSITGMKSSSKGDGVGGGFMGYLKAAGKGAALGAIGGLPGILAGISGGLITHKVQNERERRNSKEEGTATGGAASILDSMLDTPAERSLAIVPNSNGVPYPVLRGMTDVSNTLTGRGAEAARIVSGGSSVINMPSNSFSSSITPITASNLVGNLNFGSLVNISGLSGRI